MKISMVSEHASPLAALGGVDAGGQNVHVAALSSSLAKRGHQVTVYTRRDDPELPAKVQVAPGLTVVHVDADNRIVELGLDPADGHGPGMLRPPFAIQAHLN